MSNLNLIAQLQQFEQAALEATLESQDLPALHQLKSRFLGKKSELTQVLKGLKDIPESERPQIGELANRIKEGLSVALENRASAIRLEQTQHKIATERIDITLPGLGLLPGALHPLSQVIERITDIFYGLGYAVERGPEVETEFHNFEALNIPANHPARDMQDTFFVKSGQVLRTHTSPVQIRTLLGRKPTADKPVKIIVPGAVYRCDDDVTHSPMFHQIEGLALGSDITMNDLYGTIQYFAQAVFGPKTAIRFRPSFFPFTEPSAEIDIGCPACKQKRGPQVCKICKDSGWLEIMGAGMVHPNVLRNVGCDPEVIQGFAFGMGVERIAMILYQVFDIRLFFEGNQKVLEQFA